MTCRNSKNWVAWMMEYGIGDPLISFSCATLCAEVATPQQTFSADHRQRDVMFDAGLHFRSNDIAPRRFEEFHNRLVLERRRICHIDNNVHTRQRFI